jgi:hypothetical protein
VVRRYSLQYIFFIELDPAMHLAGRHGIEVWLGVIDSLQPIMKTVTSEWTEEQRHEFCEKVRENYLDPNMRLYADMWTRLIDHVNLRHCVIGRKP